MWSHSRSGFHDSKKMIQNDSEPTLFPSWGGGSPCQDLSVAGLRAGLAGERSGLFRTMVRICRILRPRIVVWENVLGALSSNQGRDFAHVVAAFTGCLPEVPDDGWGYGGFARAASPRGWHVAWRVLDSEYFGVPQRRYRVFLVASAGDGSCAEILFEPESVRGDNPPRREPGQSVTGTLAARPPGSGGLGTDMDLDGGVVAGTLTSGVPQVSRALMTTTAQSNDAESETLIPMRVAVPFDTTQITSPENRCQPKAGDPCHPLSAGAHPPAVAFSCKDHGTDAGEVAPTLRAMGHQGSHANAGGQVAVAFNWQAGGNQTTLGANTESAATLSGSTTQAVARIQPFNTTEPTPREFSGVRRLTPRECERLQGWPDDHTRWRRNVRRSGNRWQIVGDKVAEQADGPRYRQCGNGITATVSGWIARRIVKFTAR